MISIDDEIYFIEPLNATDNEQGVDGQPHAFYKPEATGNDKAYDTYSSKHGENIPEVGI